MSGTENKGVAGLSPLHWRVCTSLRQRKAERKPHDPFGHPRRWKCGRITGLWLQRDPRILEQAKYGRSAVRPTSAA